MKSTMFLVGLSVFISSHAMEQQVAPRTKINVTKGSLYDADGTVDILVVGVQEQKRLYCRFYISDGLGREIDTVGFTKFKRSNLSSAYVMKKEDDSNSTEETDHHPCNIIKHWEHNFDWKSMNSRVLQIIEPRLRQMWYGNQRENYYYSRNKDEFSGEDAITIAGEDLYACYKNVLQAGLEKLGDKQDKSIAIPTLSTSCYFPRKDAAPIAFKAITDFLNDNPNGYTRIELFVKKRWEYDLYCQFFLNVSEKDNG